MQPLFAIAGHWGSFAWFALGVIGAVGLLAVLSPRRFSALATRGGQWVDSNKLLECLDKRINIDDFVLPYSRWLGVAVLFAVALVAFVVTRYEF